MNIAEHELAILKRDPWFSQLSHDCQHEFLGHATIVQFNNEARIYRVADDTNGLWAVLFGEVRLIGYPSVGIELLALIVSVGQWFGELSTLDDKPRPHDAIAFGDVRAVHVTPAAYASVVSSHPEIAQNLTLLLCTRQRLAMSIVADHLAQPLSVRLARTLARQSLSTRNGILEIKQEELATMLNTSRQTLNRALQRLAETGAIKIGYRSIEILDRSVLETNGDREF